MASAPKKLRVWDHGTALWKVGNDLDFLIELVRKFVGSCPQSLADLTAHLSEEDFDAVECAASTLAFSLRELAAWQALQAARGLERMARQRHPARALEALRSLERELALLSPALMRVGRQLTRSEI